MRTERTELDPWALGLSAAIVTAVLFTLCALAVAIAPGFTSAAFGYMLHLDFTGISRSVTWGGYFGGVMCLSAMVGLAFAAAGALYNRLLRADTTSARADIAHRAA